MYLFGSWLWSIRPGAEECKVGFWLTEALRGVVATGAFHRGDLPRNLLLQAKSSIIIIVVIRAFAVDRIYWPDFGSYLSVFAHEPSQDASRIIY